MCRQIISGTVRWYSDREICSKSFVEIGFDSLALVDFITEVEREFDVTICEEELSKSDLESILVFSKFIMSIIDKNPENNE